MVSRSPCDFTEILGYCPAAVAGDQRHPGIIRRPCAAEKGRPPGGLNLKDNLRPPIRASGGLIFRVSFDQPECSSF